MGTGHNAHMSPLSQQLLVMAHNGGPLLGPIGADCHVFIPQNV